MATKKKTKNIDGVKKTKKSASKKSSKSTAKVKKVEVVDSIVEDAVIDTAPKETHINITEASDIEPLSEETPAEAEDIEASASEINAAIVDEPAIVVDTPEDASSEEDAAIDDAIDDTTEEESEVVEIPVSTKDITAAISSPVDEDFTDDDDDIEALIRDVANEDEKKEKENQEESSKDKKEDPMKKSKKAPRKAKPFRIISRLIAILATGSLVALLVRVAVTGILPDKYLWPSVGVAAILSFFLMFKAFRKKTHLKMLAFTDLLGVALIAAGIFGFLKIDETMRFLDNNLDTDKEYSIYNVIVSKESNYNSLDDVKGKTFHSISDFVDTAKLEAAAKEQANATISYEDGITSLLKNTMNSTTYISVLNSGTYTATIDNDDSKTYEKGLKVIGELKVEIEKTEKRSNGNLTEDSFVVFISGIDTRSGMMLDRSLSDVNIVMAVNPKTKHILLVAVPRDYYVQLHGTSGLPDKLTHAGSLGGLDLSMATIEDLLDLKFNHYIRVNFNAVIKLVDAIGGITVYSDVDYPISAWTNRGCVFYPGNNNLDGKCALAFARERYSYQTGDRHRGENQEQVIQKVIEKVSKSSTLISSYSDILDALSGSFETSIATKDITSLVNMQLSDMSGWTVETYNLDGTTGGAYTYSYPSQQLSVMYPDMSTVEIAKKKIDAVLEGVDYVDPATEAAEATETSSTKSSSSTNTTTKR